MNDEQWFSRRENPKTQTIETAVLQEQSLEIWGREPRGSDFLCVQAYRTRLEPSQRGVEFTTIVKPNKGSGSKLDARWYFPHTPGVEKRNLGADEFAAIKALKVVNKQP